MFQSMFGRLLALFMAVILLVVLSSGLFSIFSIRSSMTDSRKESLLTQAQEIAYLASQIGTRDLFSGYSFTGNNEALEYLQWKAAKVYENYGAYILIVDKTGLVMDNMQSGIKTESDALDTLKAEDLSAALTEVLQGNDVQTTISKDTAGVIYTVAVPIWSGNTIQGAVFIHTSTQIVEHQYYGLILQLSIGFAIAALAAIIGTAFYTHGIVKPLTIMTEAAEQMSQGKLSARAEITGVTEVRQLAGAFNVMAERLEKNEESRKEFVANVSHELRSPVTCIHGFVEGMLDGTIPTEDYPSYLQIVFDETNRMKRLISDLLQLSRMDKGVEKLEWSDFDINELIRRVIIGRMSELEEKKVEPKLSFFEDECKVHADRDRISQVVHNVVDNALKYVPNEGKITIRTFLLRGSTIAVEIINNGEPISEENRDKVFDRFFMAEKAHTSGKGTGLGLSICKQIMLLHGQDITVLPLEEGAGFRFTLQKAGTAPQMLEGTRVR